MYWFDTILCKWTGVFFKKKSSWILWIFIRILRIDFSWNLYCWLTCQQDHKLSMCSQHRFINMGTSSGVNMSCHCHWIFPCLMYLCFYKVKMDGIGNLYLLIVESPHKVLCTLSVEIAVFTQKERNKYWAMNIFSEHFS